MTEFELPYIIAQREWDEETNGLPMDFQNPPSIHRTVINYSPDNNIIHCGFIYHARLTDDFPKTHFQEDPHNRLQFKPKIIVGNPETDMVCLFSFHETVKMLYDWRNTLRHPEVNGDTILNWCNLVLGTKADILNSNHTPISREKLGFNWIPLDINWPSKI